MQVNIWFSRWFSSIYQIIKLLRREEHLSYKIIGSHIDPNSVMRAVCDEFFVEPQLNDTEYIDYCLMFCKQHNVQVFIPWRKQELICRNIPAFNKINTRVLVDDNLAKVQLLDDKARTYEFFCQKDLAPIPPYDIVTTVAEFKAAYARLKQSDNRVCLKFIQDTGGTSFRVIDDSIGGYNGFFKGVGLKVTYHDTLCALQEHTKFAELMIMPYLDGIEVSVDCLNTAGGLIAIPRYKQAGRVDKISFAAEILDLCHKFNREFNLKYPFNIQYKYYKGIPYLLEVNTRMSGGLYKSCVATNINIPNIAVNQAMGIINPWQLEAKDYLVSYVEEPVVFPC